MVHFPSKIIINFFYEYLFKLSDNKIKINFKNYWKTHGHYASLLAKPSRGYWH
jgi:hypothetical protein